MSLDNTQGQDAFLDIIANLVGILIILIVIVGANAAKSASEIEVVDEQLASQVHDASLAACQKATLLRKVSIDNERLELLVDAEQAAAKQLTEVRHQRLVELETVRRLIEEQTQLIATTDQASLAADTDRRLLEQRLKELNESIDAINFRAQSGTAVELKTIEHFPNPIAKTVFSEEVHFCLADGKLTWVPLDELVEEMKQHWRLVAENKSFQQTRQTIGPIDNFRLQYDLDSIGQRQKRRFRFRGFSLIPVDPNAGQSVAEALEATNSQWSQVLRGRDPKKTTVSIWVYPDSYAQHGEIKRWLQKNNYQMASWPLQHGRFISGGPDGFRTSAQ